MNQPNNKRVELCHKLYSQSAKTLWIVLNLNLLIGIGMFYVGFQLDQAAAPLQTDVYMGRAISGREEPRDTITDVRFEKRNDQIGELMGGGAFMIVMSITGAGALLWIRNQSKQHTGNVIKRDGALAS